MPSVGGFLMSRRIILFGLVALLAIVVGFVTVTGQRAVWMVKECGYWFVLATVVLFVAHLVASLRGHFDRAWWRRHRLPLFALLALAALLHVPEEHGYKIVMDEVVLQATAMGLHFERAAKVTVRAFDFAGNFIPLNFYVDKRPIFFPFLLATVHDLTGFRLSNVFWLNGVITFGLLVAVYGVGRRLAGGAAGVVAALLLATVPLVNQNATGAGFELLNLLMISLTVWLGMRYVERPDDHRMCSFLLSGVLLAQVRYESVLFLLPVAITVLYAWWRQRSVSLPWTFLALPLLLVSYPWQYNVFKVAESAWQLNDVEGATSPFGFRYFYDNVGHALNFFFSFDGSQPSSWWLAAIGIIAVGFFMLLFYKEHREFFRDEPTKGVFCIFNLGLLLHAFFMLCYFWGKWDDPIIRRLSLPTHLLLVWSVIFVLPAMVKSTQRWRVLGALTALVFVGYTLPVSARHAYTEENFAARTNTWLSAWIADHGEGRRMLAIDGNSSLLWIINQQSSTLPESIAKDPARYLFHFRNGSFDDYLVVQKIGINLDTHETYPSVEDDLGDGFTLETIAEKRFSPIYIIRLSRVVAVDETKIEAWAERRLAAVPIPKTLLGEIKSADGEALDKWLSNLP